MRATQEQDPRLSQAHIDRTRRLRREAVRRRQIIAISLGFATVLVAAASLLLRFSWSYALIPAALLLLVVALGANASRHAREWERAVARMRRGHRGAPTTSPDTTKAPVEGPVRPSARVEAGAEREHADSPRRRPDEPGGVRDGHAGSDVVETTADEANTDVMEQREIRRALKRSMGKSRNETALRNASAARQAADGASAPSEQMTTASGGAGEQKSYGKGMVAAAGEASDATGEMTGVARISGPYETQEQAARQDLISFSLGSPRGSQTQEPAAPESLEIKSTRQVSKAIPDGTDPNAAPIDPDASQAGLGRVDDGSEAMEEHVDDSQAGLNDPVSFHDVEIEAQIDAPAATQDSLGVGLEAILARRGA